MSNEASLRQIQAAVDALEKYYSSQSDAPLRPMPPVRAARCELIQAIALAVADAFGVKDVQRIGLVVDEAMRKMEE